MGGKTKNIKRVWKYFTIADYEKEEQFLTDMSSKGWRFVDTNGFLYTFERCEPEKVVYRLDYSGLGLHERDDYYAMFRDYGWEHLQDINGFSYFRKNGEGVSPEDLEIFSDDSSRLDMMKRVLLTKMIPAIIIWIAATMNIVKNILEDAEETGLTIHDWALIAIICMLTLIAGHMIGEFVRLKRKYRKAE